MTQRMSRIVGAAVAVLLSAAVGAGCGGGDASSSTSTSATCGGQSGTAWVPNVSGVTTAAHDASASVKTTDTVATGPLIGLSSDPTPSLVSVSVPASI